VSDADEMIMKFVVENYHLKADEINAESSLMASGIIDSMGLMEVVDFLESNLGVAISDEEILPANFESVSVMVNFVESKK